MLGKSSSEKYEIAWPDNVTSELLKIKQEIIKDIKQFVKSGRKKLPEHWKNGLFASYGTIIWSKLLEAFKEFRTPQKLIRLI
jgi:hypothetical protein